MSSDELTGKRYDNGKIDIVSFLRDNQDFSRLLNKYIENDVNNTKTYLLPSEFNNIPVTDEDRDRYLPLYKDCLDDLVRHCKYGAEIKGYGVHNWLGGMKWSRVVNSLLRHLFAFVFCNMYFDKESGSRHMTAVLWNALTLLVYQKERIGGNDLH